ncbi:glutamate 5-kinase [Gelidibacter maritimus]|uniref:Glutamate 5-kinase n=1 Tax=Gelidibacter maritimus TaxID=2761487 RepID=A0A7W2R462_9FLAO|nr:glutamate 5-kinase [Gelidibacter maritimus]MBA6153373.1 glutamate 5-kinase [Gelidibacter maritimus]
METKRIVVKVGTNVLTNKDNRILGPVLRELVRQISVLNERDVEVILVSSGSAIAGKEILGETSIQDPSIRRQVYSSVGQPRMMRHYYSLFHDYGMRCAQVLATKRDFDPGKHRENMINCYEGLLAEGITPIANEDDATSLTMSMFTDNDELASLVAELLDVDRLIILSDTNGLYTGHPDDEDSTQLKEVSVNQAVEQYVKASGKKEGEGRGGMASKLKIAKGTARKNIPTYIANGKLENVIVDIVDNKEIGTKFINKKEGSTTHSGKTPLPGIKVQ